jgi:hypothetical protein
MDSERTAAEVFGLLADETRVDVLRTIARAQNEHPRSGVAALSFSELYDRVDVDGTSKLSYHLGELTDTFLRKHEGGYAFTHAGEQLVRFVLAENFRSPPAFDPVDAPGVCLHCGETALQATLHDQFFLVECGACERPAFSYRVRPAQIEAHENGRLIDAVVREQAGDFVKMRGAVCPDCTGRLETEVVDTDEIPVSKDLPVEYLTSSACQQCLRFLSVPLTHAAAYHPESVAFHWDRGFDVMGTGVWQFHRHLEAGNWKAERTATDPAEYRVQYQHESRTLRLYLDRSGRVTRTERVRRSGSADR